MVSHKDQSCVLCQIKLLSGGVIRNSRIPPRDKLLRWGPRASLPPSRLSCMTQHCECMNQIILVDPQRAHFLDWYRVHESKINDISICRFNHINRFMLQAGLAITHHAQELSSMNCFKPTLHVMNYAFDRS